uniref:Uncharacterized protein n=1 Tax=Anguilla anguilla TaxID=7936 RepID=A0A0E9PL56_ANGAN
MDGQVQDFSRWTAPPQPGLLRSQLSHTWPWSGRPC